MIKDNYQGEREIVLILCNLLMFLEL